MLKHQNVQHGLFGKKGIYLFSPIFNWECYDLVKYFLRSCYDLFDLVKYLQS